MALSDDRIETERPYSVSEITSAIKVVLERGFPSISVEGEVSNARHASSGHLYFTLKDDQASISCVMFRNRLERSSVRPADGEQITVEGSIGVYARRGSYQIIVERASKTGIGRILQMLEERKRRLAAEGLFDAERKKSLPVLPRRVAIVTSPSGAAIRDILNVLGRRNAGVHVVVVPCTVQGDDAGEQIAAQLRRADTLQLGDVIIVTRGGGSIEDLLAFSDESVVRAIAEASTPVISAVGHETDTTLSDLAADLRAPTPSAAAEVVSASREDLLARTVNTGRTVVRSFLDRLERARLAISRFSPDDLERTIRYVLQPRYQELDELQSQLQRSMQERLLRSRHRLEMARGAIDAASPYDALERGYVMVLDGRGEQVLTRAARAVEEREVLLRFRDVLVSAESTRLVDEE